MNTETKFTPGPWNVSHGANWFPSIGSLTTHEKICDLPSDMSKNGQRNDEVNANANLIAAAPEMYEALNMMTALCRLKYGNLDKDVYAEILKAESALNKANGK